ncbi:Bcr/CflA family efflux MFS transporter [Parahaliea aestuarii]|uniref:Bcr/CflA family efflux transporter n=1 Tax=Parahaliea aestuarii TaxID=1852021 RepID=A0A5C8ZS62_9GAMM|nr:Bcr/CflA family efflux MFS transporter [Parahaliea aestuarii]TXS90347.1 multidrug effflux MFS transporter [Parahaliea aestuarii]
MQENATIPVSVVFVLGFTMMLGPFAIDTYLPAFPLIAESLGVTIHQVSLSISIYMLGFAVGQLSGGAFSDRYGRRRVLVTGLWVFALAAFYLSRVDSLQELLAGRFVQSVGGGWIGVSIPAIVRDQVQGVQAAKLFSMIGMVSIVAPAIAPAIGAAILEAGSWGLIFVYLGAYALAMLPLLMATVFRGPRKPRPADGIGFVERYISVVKTPSALPYILWQTASFGGLIMFVTYASFIYQDHFQQSRGMFTLLFACNIFAMFACVLLNRLLLNRLSPRPIMYFATRVQVVAAALVLLAAVLEWPVFGFLPAMMLYAGTLGAISPNIQACYLEDFPRSAASAAAVMGTAQFGLGGAASALSNLLPEALLSVVICIAACAVASFLCMHWSRRRESARQD